ncbi:MAG TPA: hypothetical protein VG432_03415 [Gemmatimonadaceae bacterium]|nr:hypothetical protein [Gemmatimonadaceae bacterium]
MLSRVARDGAQAGTDAEALGEDTWTATMLLDRLAVYTTDVAQRTRDEIIHRQQAEMLELSIPVVKLCYGGGAAPGT